MGLDITCHSVCGEQLSNETCSGFSGCRWSDLVSDDVTHACLPAEAGGGESTIWVGVVLSLVADVIVNIGMNAMKHAHNINTSQDGTPIKSFLTIPWWWIGIVGIVGGEVGNVVAYGYAPASIVTPMGAVGVLTNVIITTYVLKEPFSTWNCVGVVGVVGGIVMVVYYAPRATIILHAPEMWEDLIWTPQFLAYTVIFLVLLGFFLSIGKRYGEQTVFVYIGTCAVIASLTIVSSKTFSSIVAESLATGDGSHWKYPAPYISLVLMVGTAVLSMGYVNTAMMHFGNSVVVPTYYAMFTVTSVAAVALVYREFDCMTELGPSLAFGCGIIFTVVGVGLLQTGKSDVVRLEEDTDEEEEPSDVGEIVSRSEARYKVDHRMSTIEEESFISKGSGSQITRVGGGQSSPYTDTPKSTTDATPNSNFLISTAEPAGHPHVETWPPGKVTLAATKGEARWNGSDDDHGGRVSVASVASAPAGALKRRPSTPLEHVGAVSVGEGYTHGSDRSLSLDRYSTLARTPGGSSRTPRTMSREGIAIMSLSGAVLTMPLDRTPSSARPVTPGVGVPRSRSSTDRLREREGSLSLAHSNSNHGDAQCTAVRNNTYSSCASDQQPGDGALQETPRVSPMPSAPPSPEAKPASFAGFTPKTPVRSLMNSLSIPRANHLPALPFIMRLPAQYVQDYEAESSALVDASPVPADEGGEAGTESGGEGSAVGEKESTGTSLMHRMATSFSPSFSAFSPRLPGLHALNRGSRLIPVEPDSLSRAPSGGVAQSSCGRSARSSRSGSRSPNSACDAAAISPLPLASTSGASQGNGAHKGALGTGGKAPQRDAAVAVAITDESNSKDLVLSVEADGAREGGAAAWRAEGQADAHALMHTQISLFPSPAKHGSFSTLASAAENSSAAEEGKAVEQDIEAGEGADKSESVASWAEAAQAVAHERSGVVGVGVGEGSLIEQDSNRWQAGIDDVSPLIAPPSCGAGPSPLKAAEEGDTVQEISEGRPDIAGGSDAGTCSRKEAEPAVGDDSVDYDV